MEKLNWLICEKYRTSSLSLILEGSYTPEGVFQSHNVIVKCPSKYAGEDA